jgi:hypothetical protein
VAQLLFKKASRSGSHGVEVGPAVLVLDEATEQLDLHREPVTLLIDHHDPSNTS